MENLNMLLESANPWTDRQNEASKLGSKWESTGLLKNLANEYDRNNMSVILENQARSLVQEANVTGGTISMSGGAGENWAGVALPLVRRIFGEIVAKEFVSVQPMSLPSGLVFYLDFKYANSVGGVQTAGTSLYGNQADNHPNVKNLDAAGGLYGAGRFTYSTNQFSSSAVIGLLSGSSANPANAATGSITTATWANVNFDASLSASVLAGQVLKATISASALPNYDIDAVRGFVLVSGSATITRVVSIPRCSIICRVTAASVS